jgi:hypothetical protein
MTVPGVAPIDAVAFLPTIDDLGRFRHARDVNCYLCLAPTRANRESLLKRPFADAHRNADPPPSRISVEIARKILGQIWPSVDCSGSPKSSALTYSQVDN